MNAVLAAFAERPAAEGEFERCSAWLEEALEYAEGTHTLADVRAGVASGHYHLWPGKQSAAITEVFQFPRARVLNVFLAGGDLDEILEMERDFCSWGAFLGCSDIAMTGREGWKRPLKNLGWRQQAIVLVKPLRKAQQSE